MTLDKILGLVQTKVTPSKMLKLIKPLISGL
jgi:hypothetical protein